MLRELIAVVYGLEYTSTEHLDHRITIMQSYFPRQRYPLPARDLRTGKRG